MSCLDNVDLIALNGMTVWGDDEACKLPRPIALYRVRHGGSGFAGAHDEGPSRGLRGQSAGNQILSLDSLDCLVKKGF
jgi:hypothetical protein